MNVGRWVALCVMKHVMVMIVTAPVCVVTDIWYHSLQRYTVTVSIMTNNITHTETLKQFPRHSELFHLLGTCKTNVAATEIPSVPRLFPATTPNNIDLCSLSLSLSHFQTKLNKLNLFGVNFV